MCGIAGIIDLDGQELISADVVERMCRSIAHRGPDDRGVVTGQGFGLGSCRLSILDLSPQGHMPMAAGDERYHIVYNGEVYNFKSLRKKLEADGERFRSHTDTEVVLKSIIRHGPDFLHEFNGMFAFALHDALAKRTLLVRDRLGVKPLFYYLDRRKLYFGSEIKALWAAGVPKAINAERLGEQFALRYVAGEETIYQGVKRLLPGHYLVAEKGQVLIRRWWGMKDAVRGSSPINQAGAVEWYRETFDDAVALRRISDVPVGVLLSGGLDSGSVAAAMAVSAPQAVSSFTVRFKEKEYDEGRLVRLVVDKYGLDYHELFIHSEKLLELSRQIYHIHDEPMVHASDLYLMEIAKLAKSKVTVLLSGEGGDETLGGYRRYEILDLPRILKAGLSMRSLLALLPPMHRKLRKFAKLVSLGSIDNVIHFNATDVYPTEIARLGVRSRVCSDYRSQIVEEAATLFPDDYMRQVMYYDMHIYLCSLLDRGDLMTMGASIECRVPFLDYRLVQGLLSLPTEIIRRNREPKGLLKDALGSRLPPEVLRGRKWGFGIPWQRYYVRLPEFRSEIAGLHQHPLFRDCFSNTAGIRELCDSFLNGDLAKFPIVHQLVTIKFWYDHHFCN